MRRKRLFGFAAGALVAAGSYSLYAWLAAPKAAEVEVPEGASAEANAALVLVPIPGLEPASLAAARELFDAAELARARSALAGSLEEAEADCEGALCVLLSVVARRQHDADAALDYGLRGAQLLPGVGVAHHVYARAIGERMRTGGMVAAMKNLGPWKNELRNAIELDPRNVDARMEELFFFAFVPKMMGGDPQRADLLLAELDGLDPLRATVMRARVLQHRDAPEEALGLLDEALMRSPGAGELALARGDVLLALERTGEADAAYEVAQGGEDEESKYRALFLRARMRLSAEPIEEEAAGEALGFLDTYVEAAPRGEYFASPARAHWRRGVAFERLGRVDEARAAYTTATTLEPDLAEARAALDALD